MAAKRQKKPDSARTQPNRKSSLYGVPTWIGGRRSRAASNGENNGNGEPTSGGAGDASSGGAAASVRNVIDSCKKILDDQVERGRKAASAQGGAFGSLSDQAERMIRAVSDAVIDVSTMWIDYIGSVTQAGDWFPRRDAQDGGQPTVQISPAGAATVDLKLAADTELETLRFQPLMDSDGNVWDTGIQAVAAPSDDTWFRLVVRASQPEGRYHGAVLDETSGEVRGTLSVEVKRT